MIRAKMFLSALVVLACAAIVLGIGNVASQGKKVSASYPPTNITGLELQSVNVYNSSTNDLYVGINMTTNLLAVAMTNNSAAVIAPGREVIFDASPNGPILNLSLCTSTNSQTNIVYVGGIKGL